MNEKKQAHKRHRGRQGGGMFMWGCKEWVGGVVTHSYKHGLSIQLLKERKDFEIL